MTGGDWTEGDLARAWTPNLGHRIGYEARCGACGESFRPAGPDDLVHIEREDGTPCGGAGVMRGAWYSARPPR